jgi:hypothetical protein
MRVGGAIQSSVGRFDWFFSSCATALKCPISEYQDAVGHIALDTILKE